MKREKNPRFCDGCDRDLRLVEARPIHVYPSWRGGELVRFCELCDRDVQRAVRRIDSSPELRR